MLSIILFFGFSQVVEALATIAFGTSEQSIPGGELGRALRDAFGRMTGDEIESGPVEILGQSFPSAWIVSGVASLVSVALVYLYLYRTRTGYLDARRHVAPRRGAGDRHRRASRLGDRLRRRHRSRGGQRRVRAPSCWGRSPRRCGVDLTVVSFAVIVRLARQSASAPCSAT